MLSGPGGEFSFTGLSKGQYSLQALKPGFVPAGIESDDGPGNMVMIPSSTGAAIKLAPLGAIEGTIVNQYGDPLRNVTVALLQSQVVDGERAINRPPANKVTNDLGQFRFYDVYPGEYYVKAMNRAGGTSTYVGESAVRYDSWEGFRPVYFGGTPQMDSATPIAIETGSQARADFKLSVEPTYKVRGSLENFAPHQGTAVFELLEGDYNLAASRVSLNADTGRFEIDDVAAGQYNLRVTQGLSRGEVQVAVNGGDTNGVSVSMVPAVTVSGSVRVDGPALANQDSPANLNGFSTRGRNRPASCNISLRPGQESAQIGMGVPHMGNGPEFTLSNVFAGQYQARIQCFGGYAESAVAGATDLLADPILTVSPGVAPPPIEITIKPGGGSAHAKLPKPPSDGQAALLLMPAFRATGPVVAYGMKFGEPDEAVGFEAVGLAPGDYLAYAFADVSEVEFRNPNVLRNLGGSVSVHIEDNKTTEITLPGWVK